MKDLIFSHYTVKDIDPAPWTRTWETLSEFGERFAPKLAPLGIKLKLRKVILDDITEDNLMMGNMVTIESPELGLKETPIENLLMLELDFTDCDECAVPGGAKFPCRTFRDFDGKDCQALPEEFFMEAALRVAFSAQEAGGCGCLNCSSCASGCGDEEQGICNDHFKE